LRLNCFGKSMKRTLQQGARKKTEVKKYTSDGQKMREATRFGTSPYCRGKGKKKRRNLREKNWRKPESEFGRKKGGGLFHEKKEVQLKRGLKKEKRGEQ